MTGADLQDLAQLEQLRRRRGAFHEVVRLLLVVEERMLRSAGVEDAHDDPDRGDVVGSSDGLDQGVLIGR